MVLFDDVLFSFKKIECFNVKNNFQMLLNVFQSPGHDNESLNILQEMKILMRIQKKLLDLKSSDVGNSINFSQIGSLQDEVPDDIKNANIISDNNDNANRNN